METSPTIGFNVGTLDLDKKTSLTVWDVGGQKSMRSNWRYYLNDCKALVFVVDSSDSTRIREAQEVLKKVLGDEKVRGIPLMVLANKMDLPNSMSIEEVRNTVHSILYTAGAVICSNQLLLLLLLFHPSDLQTPGSATLQ